MDLTELKKLPEKASAFDKMLTPSDVFLDLAVNYEKAVVALKKIANEDFRGNRSQASVDAYKTLRELGEI